MKLDEKDKKILLSLAEDGRMSIADISIKTKLRRDAVARRIKKLRKEGVLERINPIINPVALGVPNLCYVVLRIKMGEEENRKTFVNHLIQMKYLYHVSELIGKYDFILIFFYKDMAHLDTMVQDVKSVVPNYVLDFEIFQTNSKDVKLEKIECLLD